MKILTVRQPWAALIVAGIKDVENRSWGTDYRGPLLILAGKQWDGDVSTAVLDYLDDHPDLDMHTRGIIGMVELVDITRKHPSRWFTGPLGWILENARPLPFIPWRGTQHLAEAPPALVEMVTRKGL
jgi:hypothetical protein